MAHSRKIRVSKDFQQWMDDFQKDLEKTYGRFISCAMASDELLARLKKRKASDHK